MTNLEDMVHEKDDRTNNVKSRIALALTEEEKNYNSRVKDIEVKGAADLNRIEQNYVYKLTDSLMRDLNQDVNAMKQRAEYLAYPKEKIKEITNLKNAILDIKSKIKGEDNSVDSLLSALPKKTQKLLNELPNIENMQDKAIITTYVSSNGGGCYILTPVSDNPLDKFSKEIENKLLGVINVGKVGAGEDCLFFKGESPDYVNNFLMFKIGTPQPELLKKELIKKLNDERIQPQSFKEENMVHRAISLDYNILKNFMNYKESAKEESGVRVYGKRGPYKKRVKENGLGASVVSQEPKEIIGIPNKGKSGHSAISSKYANPQIAINAYNIINDKFRKENEKDMVLTKLLNLEIGGKGGGALYDSLINHIKDGTIKPEAIHSRSNLEKYINKEKIKSEEDYQNVGDIHPVKPQTDAMNAKHGNWPIAEYEQFKLKYDALTKEYKHKPTRTEMGWNRREFYKGIKESEAKYGILDFIPYFRSGKKSKK